jgi:manganese/iron transport system permease protein
MMMNELLLPFQFAFMNSAFLIMTIIAVPTSLLSCFLVLKGWSLMGDAISHAVLPGVVIAYIIGIPLIIGAFLQVCSVLSPRVFCLRTVA